MNIIFMGTSEFAVPTLVALNRNHSVQAVFTQPPRPSGRKMQLVPSQVHKVAASYAIPVFTPAKLRNNVDFFAQIRAINAEVIVVCSYGLIIPDEILRSKRYGCLNIHPSSLPKYRGAAPMQRAIMNQEHETEVCIMQMDQGLDTGDVIMRHPVSITKHTNYPALHDICAELGAHLLLRTIEHLDTLPRMPQKEEGVSYASKLTKEEAQINWDSSASQISSAIRAMVPWPGSYFSYEGQQIKTLAATCTEKEHDFPPGYVMNDLMEVACKSGTLIIEAMQRPGGKILQTKEFLRGFSISSGKILS